jgi:hypothetical protein
LLVIPFLPVAKRKYIYCGPEEGHVISPLLFPPMERETIHNSLFPPARKNVMAVIRAMFS